MDLRTELARSTAHRPSRDRISGYVTQHPQAFDELIELSLATTDENHHKACWNLELVLEKNIEWLQPHLATFCAALDKITDDSARRSISKICLFVSQKQFGPKGDRDFATDEQLQQIASTTFDWLLDESKVATKAYSMRALFQLGKRYDWIYPELKAVLQKDFHQYSAGYKSAAKHLLARL